ncbi:MAG: peptidylprolyl isomerase [Candidatus Nitronauta litoralis]|uniref:Peptidyl-prolyl cis-trans isomerase n=1 Tax=Candidatus Nitronauta litoralis TaxID=2705533 RepID=A0A7T0G068_9BACT|nr:MAG: peptidylprolyl isomerase [Candidatus Nitronauta litoralis]
MIIEKECVVAINFTVKDEDDNVLESSPAEEPLVYLHGAGNLVIGLEKGLKGMKVGEKETITVYPEEGFGEVVPELKVKAEKSMFPPEIQLEVDRVLERDEGGEKTRYRIVAIDGDTVYMDGNHPMAGKNLHYSVEVVSIRPATDDELEKGQPDVIVH